jgi:hypothetical protein
VRIVISFLPCRLADPHFGPNGNVTFGAVVALVAEAVGLGGGVARAAPPGGRGPGAACEGVPAVRGGALVVVLPVALAVPRGGLGATSGAPLSGSALPASGGVAGSDVDGSGAGSEITASAASGVGAPASTAFSAPAGDERCHSQSVRTPARIPVPVKNPIANIRSERVRGAPPSAAPLKRGTVV